MSRTRKRRSGMESKRKSGGQNKYKKRCRMSRRSVECKRKDMNTGRSSIFLEQMEVQDKKRGLKKGLERGKERVKEERGVAGENEL